VNSALLIAAVLALRGDLTHPSYPVRHRAQSTIAHMGPACLSAVEILAASPDPDLADWATREAAHKRQQAARVRAEAFMAELDPKEWACGNWGYPLPAVVERVNALVARLYLDPRMAVEWAALAHVDRLIADEDLTQMVETFGGADPVGPPPPMNVPYFSEPVGYWQVRYGWERRFNRALLQSIPAPRVVPGNV
jgi:hypothetical protein